MEKKRTTLTDAQEMLLGKYLDNEATFFERLAARKLISREPAANRYIASIQRIQKPLKDALPLMNSSLWMRISARLHAEERSELLLGKRRFRSERSFSPVKFFLQGGAAAALAAVALFMVIPKNGDNLGQPSNVASTAIERPQVAVQRGVPMTMPASVGVDWMRSDGRLQVMHDPDERAPLIFVKRRYNRVGPIYRTERNSQGVVMQENRSVPQGIVVNSSR